MFTIPKKMTVLVMIVALLSSVVAVALAGGSGESSMENHDGMAKNSMAPMTEGGRQVEFSTLANAQAFAADGPVVLFFAASWCPPCNAAKKDLKENARDLASDITVVTVDYDNSADLKTKYGVTMQHTFVQIDRNGNKVAIWNGGMLAKINQSVKRM